MDNVIAGAIGNALWVACGGACLVGAVLAWYAMRPAAGIPVAADDPVDKVGEPAT